MTTETISSDAAEGAELLATAQQALEDLKAVDPVVLDVRELSSVMDWLVVASGTSSRHVKSLADNVMICLLYTSPSPRDLSTSRMPSSA